MAIYVAAVRLATGGTGVEHIAEVIWMYPDHTSSKLSVTAAIPIIDKTPGTIKVSDGKSDANVEVVRPAGGSPYIRSQPDRSKKDNLLSLPRY